MQARLLDLAPPDAFGTDVDVDPVAVEAEAPGACAPGQIGQVRGLAAEDVDVGGLAGEVVTILDATNGSVVRFASVAGAHVHRAGHGAPDGFENADESPVKGERGGRVAAGGAAAAELFDGEVRAHATGLHQHGFGRDEYGHTIGGVGGTGWQGQTGRAYSGDGSSSAVSLRSRRLSRCSGGGMVGSGGSVSRYCRHAR